MTYEEFEWHILKMVYEEGLERLQPAFIAYALGLPHETVSTYLEHATHSGLLEMDVTNDGRIEYFVPGVEAGKVLPRPLWKDEFDGEAAPDDEASASAEADGSPAVIATAARISEPGADADDPLDGSVHAQPRPDQQALVRYGQPRRARGARLPSTLRAHIQERYGGADGSVLGGGEAAQVAILDREATADDAHTPVASTELVRLDQEEAQEHGPSEHLPLRIEASEDTFSDPSQTIFMRQLKVFGVKSEEELRDHVERLFGSFGYKPVYVGDRRLRFERGSVTFILALVPLFVLVVPLFVYLLLYTMGRSTIHQEPIELDVQFRRSGDQEDSYEIDLTFIGMHGVVLGAADQRVLNQEVDTLRDELQWSLTG